MAKLSAKHESFIQLMKKSEEHARKGFELLAAQSEPEFLFDAIDEAGLFSPDNNLAPVPADDPNYFRVPYWGALDYLEVVARRAGENRNPDLSQKVIVVVRNVTENTVDGSADNYHTWRKFAEITGILPSEVVTIDDMDMLPVWLKCKFDTGGVVHALDLGVLKKYLDSESPDNWEKACRVLLHCTAIRWEDNGTDVRHKSRPEIDSYWLKKLINNHSKAFGKRCGAEAAKILRDRVREFFQKEAASVFTRPAVEDHPQNHDWEHSANALVEGLRDVLLAWWSTSNSDSAREFVGDMLTDDNDMVRRIGIYILDRHWTQLGDLYTQVLSPELFISNHIHELYNLLKNNFAKFDKSLQKDTVDSLHRLPKQRHSDDPERALKLVQRQWLSAVVGMGCEIADRWYEELNNDPTLGALSTHPEFLYYTESFVGTGSSPFETSELIGFAEKGVLVEKLNNFVPTDSWRGPSKKSLVDALGKAVQQAPEIFLKNLPAFIDVDRPYQYGVISGFKELWSSSKGSDDGFDWYRGWQDLLAHIEQILSTPTFWTEDVLDDDVLTPTRDWMPPIISELLQAGTKKDEHAYHPDMLPAGWRLIQILLEKSESVSDPSEEAMSQAINSPKGKAIEALFNHSLRVCRLADQEANNHTAQWEELGPIFDGELIKCKNDNYEFSTLAASYLVNLEYLDKGWLKKNITKIFPKEYQSNFNCALNGFSFAQASRSNYELLVNNGIIDYALRIYYKAKHARERLIQRICLAYLWGDEQLDSPRLVWMFENQRHEDLRDASDFFWGVHDQELGTDQRNRIIEFFRQSVAWANNLHDSSKVLLSSLSLLSCYLLTVTESDRELLLAVAPYVNINHNFTFFIENLDRLADDNSSAICTVLGRVLEVYSPLHDYRDHLKNLLIKLIKAGHQVEVLSYVDLVRNSLPDLATEIFQLVDNKEREI